MSAAPSSSNPAKVTVSPAATVAPAFVLLFAVTPDAAAGRATSSAGLEPMSDDASLSFLSVMEALQRRLLGESYSQASRLRRTAVGRMGLGGGAGELTHADVYLVIHKCGAAVWEVILFGPSQPIDVARWVRWLDLESHDSPTRAIWDKLAATRQGKVSMPEMYVPLAVVQVCEGTLETIMERYSRELVALLHRDASDVGFKASFVNAEIAADFCREEDGLWLLARNGAIAVNAHSNHTGGSQLPPDTLPLLLTLEVLCLDRAVLRSFLDRFAQRAYATVDDLIQLRREIFDNLEEYYGTLAKTHSYTADSIERGEILFGIDDLFEAVADRLEALTFEITTRNQQSVNRLGLWLTTSFGAIETGFVAASIATWYYANTNNLIAVLSWTVGVTLATAIAIASFLQWTMKP